MSGGTQKTTQTSGPSDPNVTSLISKFARGVSGAYQPGGTTYTAPGATTTGSWDASLGAAGNTDFSSGISGALKSYSNRAAGNELGLDDQLYAQQRARLSDDVLTQSKNAFNLSGMLGSDQNQYHAGRGLADALGGLDLTQRNESYGRQAEAAGMLPKLFQNSLLPSSVTGAVGAAQDADAAAKQNGGLDYQAKLAQIIAQMSGAGPQSTTTTQPSTPWWQTAASLALAAL